MNPPLLDDVWKRKGVNILWSGVALGELNAASKVISLRRLFELYETDWPEDQIPWVDDKALIIAGLDVTIDALTPDETETWLEKQIYTKIQDYQSAFDSQCSLIFWMSDQTRWKEKPDEVEYDWYLSGRYSGRLLPIGRCIWNGAQSGVRRIETLDSNGKPQWIGLHHHRIS